MAKVKVTCPHCAAGYWVSDRLLGKNVSCERCTGKFVMTRASKTLPSDTKVPVQCPHCQTAYKVSESYVGRGASCRKCGDRFILTRTTVVSTAASKVRRTTDPGSDPGHSPEDQVPAEWKVGDRLLDLYEVRAVLGEGGMGKVYRVHHAEWNMDLAVKSLLPKLLKSKGAVKNFIREAETWVNLGLHPHSVSCYYVRTLGGIPRLFAECVEGGSLLDWIRGRDGLPPRLYEGDHEEAYRTILDIAIQFAWGLDFAHEKGLIHQDVKPANLMMTPDGTAKVTDFGLANARAVVGGSAREGAGSSIMASWGGMTPAYCSPEQAARQALSRRTDIWSWGVSVLEMFTGKMNRKGGPAAPETLTEYLDAGSENPDIPPMPMALAELLHWCFEKNPEDRPRNMQEVVARLREIYLETTGEEHSRLEPRAADLLADGLNNRAVSLLDLGKEEEARKLFEEALKIDLHHLESNYNRGLLSWRRGQITDEELVWRMEEVRTSHQNDWRAEYFLGLIHLERSDAEAAVKALEEAAHLAPESSEMEHVLELAHSGIGAWPRWLGTLRDHSDCVESVAITADGKLALSGSWDRTVKLWQLETGECLRTMEGHSDYVESVAISADGRWGLSGSLDRTVRFWDLETGECLRVLKGHTNYVESVAMSADGGRAISRSKDKTLRLWDLASGKCLRVLEGLTDHVETVAITSDGLQGVSGNGDKTLKLWDFTGGRLLRALRGHTDRVNAVALSGDGRYGLSGSKDKTLRLWDLTSGTCLHTFEGHTDAVISVAMSADGRYGLSGGGDIFSGSDNRTLKYWDLDTGRCLRTFEGHGDRVNAVALSADGRYGLSGSHDRTLKLWYTAGSADFRASFALCQVVASEEVLDMQRKVAELIDKAKVEIAENRIQSAYVYLKEARGVPGYEREPSILKIWSELLTRGFHSRLQSSWALRTLEGEADSLKLWDIATGKRLRPFQSPTEWVYAVAVSPDGKHGLAVSGQTFKLWNLEEGVYLRSFTGHGGSVHAVTFSPDGQYGLSGSYDNTIRLWELATGKCVSVFEGHTGAVYTVRFTPDGRYVLSGSGEIRLKDDNTLRLWDIATGKCWRTFTGHTNKVSSAVVSGDGEFILSGSHDRTLRLWDSGTGKLLRTFTGHTGKVNSVAVTSEWRYGISGSQDNTIKIWHLGSGRCLATFEGHTNHIESVAVSPDGNYIISGSSDNTLKIWDLGSGACLRTFEGHTNRVTSVAVSPDGKFVLSGSYDNTLRLWQLDWDYEFPEEVDWDEGLRPHLDMFITLHKGNWSQADWDRLVRGLQLRGYGWVRPAGVRRQLEELRRRYFEQEVKEAHR